MKRRYLHWGTTLVLWLFLAILAVGCSAQNEQSFPSDIAPVSSTLNPSPTTQQTVSASVTQVPSRDPGTETPAFEDATSEPSPIATETIEAMPTLPVVSINGMPSDQFMILSSETRDNIRQIAVKGAELGRNPEVFSILGDSLIATNQSLAKWDSDDYALGDYEFLQPTIDQYSGSFGRYGPSVRVGLHSWSVFDPLWADKEFCLSNEDVLACEIRLSNPSVMIIFLGSNDAGSPGGFNVNYRQLVEVLIDQGIVPILATKADRFEGGDNVNNDIIRKIAVDFQVPLMEFDLLADTLPGRGLGPDNVHLTFLEPVDYNSAELFAVGYPVHNLASLMILDAVRREISAKDQN